MVDVYQKSLGKLENSTKSPTLPPGLQVSSQCVGKLSNLLSRASSRAGIQERDKLVALQGTFQEVSLLLLPPEMLLLRP